MKTFLLWLLLWLPGMADAPLPRMPNIVGLSLQEAEKALVQSKIVDRKVIRCPDKPVGQCFQQFPEAGEGVGTTAFVYVGVPHMRKRYPIQGKAAAAPEAAGPPWGMLLFVIGQFVLAVLLVVGYRFLRGREPPPRTPDPLPSVKNRKRP